VLRSASARQGALNRVASKHFDFVVCRLGDFSVLCAVELNDKTHSSKRGQARDEFVVGVCRAIGLPLLQVPAQRSYSVADIRVQLQAASAGVAVSDGLHRAQPTKGESHEGGGWVLEHVYARPLVQVGLRTSWRSDAGLRAVSAFRIAAPVASTNA